MHEAHWVAGSSWPRSRHRSLRSSIEELTSCNVIAFLSQAHVEPDITIEIFFVDGPLKGFGAVVIAEPE